MDYQRIYNQIIERAQKENRKRNQGIYYEKHHILPICLGGEGNSRSHRPHPNIVLLTAREHFLCHHILCKIYPDNDKLAFALLRLCYSKTKNRPLLRISSRLYEELKNRMSKARTGVKKSKESIEKRTKTRRERGNYKRTAESIQKGIDTKRERGNLGYGPHSVEHRKKLSERKKGTQNASKALVDISTGKVYKATIDAIKVLKISYHTVYKGLESGQFERLPKQL